MNQMKDYDGDRLIDEEVNRLLNEFQYLIANREKKKQEKATSSSPSAGDETPGID